jgi:hypothetical protein
LWLLFLFLLGSPFKAYSIASSPSLSAMPPLAPMNLAFPSVGDLLAPDYEGDDSEHSPISEGRSDLPGGGLRSSRVRINEDCRSPGGSEASASSQQPPSFTDLVKRSTRFITAVPAADVLLKVEEILEASKANNTATPLGIIGRIELHWESFLLQVWGSDIFGPPQISLQLYQIPQSSSVASSPVVRSSLTSFMSAASPRSSFGFGSFTGTDEGLYMGQSAAPQQLFLVEFIRGQLEIFAFKRFYQWLRGGLSELVKRDYEGKSEFAAASPM